MPLARPSHIVFLIACAATFIWWSKWRGSGPVQTKIKEDDLSPANATLGFGGIYVVSQTGSKRLPSLLRAANITELELQVPYQKEWSAEDIEKFKLKGDKSTMPEGNVLSWLGHSNVIESFLASGADSALILEDDVDFDIRLRTRQIPLAAAAFQDLTVSSLASTLPDPDFWPDPSVWDILYLGHCGDYFSPLDHALHDHGTSNHSPQDLADMMRLGYTTYADSTVLSRRDTHLFTASLFAALGVPAGRRLIHESRMPLCSFGYAITRKAALRLHFEIMPPREPATKPGKLKAWDVYLMAACGDRQFDCWSLQPELFHHLDAPSEIDTINAHAARPPVDAMGEEQVMRRHETSNIACGARSEAFNWEGAYGWKAEERLEFLREEVGRKGKCLKDHAMAPLL